MTARRLSFASNRRPVSAIFIGSDSLPPPSPPSPANSSSSSRSQLPSPPATNSTGSIGDSSSTSAGSVRRSGMPNGDRRSTHSDDDDDINELDNDEDDTAKLSNDRRTAKGKQADLASSTIQRVKSLTARNRKVIDKLSSITSDTGFRSSFSTPSAASSSRSRSPLPPAFSSSSSSSTASTHSRVSFARDLRGGSGSETEREQQRRPISRENSFSSEDNDAETPPASARRPTTPFERIAPRQRLRSAPSSPAKPPVAPPSPRKQASTSFTVIGSGRRSRRVSIQQPPDDLDETEQASAPPPTAGGSGNKKFRAPLPREFRDRRSLDGRSVTDSSASTSTSYAQDRARTTSPGVLVANGSASPHSSGAGGTFSAAPTSPRAHRPARPSTVRETSKRVHRWSSVDEASLNGTNPGDEDGRRQWRHAGSAESPLGGREGRSVVGEGLRAAGLARRGSDDVFAEGAPQRRTRLSGGLGNRPTLNGRGEGDLDELRRGIARVGLGLPDQERDPRTPASAGHGSSRYGTTRNIHTVLAGNSSRAATSLASYGADEDGPRTAPPPLRNYRSSYVGSERASVRQASHHERSRTSPAVGAFGRTTPQFTSPAPSSEHARLMLDSLAMFESQLARLPPGVPDLARAAQTVVQSASGLNTLLRSGNARALEAQIEAEVGDAAAQVDASEVWRQVGGEYRESLRVSDELVRTLTALLLGVGRLVREAVKERGAGSPDQGGGGSGRSSLDGDDRDRDRVVRAPRRSLEADGRNSVEGSVHRESRRSWEDVDGSRRGRVDLNSRPSTSLSMARDRDRGMAREDDGDETARERERSSALERLSIRRAFPPRSRDTIHASPSQDSPDPNYPSPTPAPRSSFERNRDTHHRSLPPLAVPPPLPSLPSESLERKSSSKGRRGKLSNTSNATVRGTSIFPTLNTPNPTTALSAQTVSAAGEVTAFPLLRADSSPSTALSGLQQQQERDVRKRTISSTSARDGEAASGSSGSSDTRALRGTRVRMSLDRAEIEPAQENHASSQPPAINGERRERRRTINDIFPS